ncbi:MAG: tyrosine decarboxylase MfnA [Candidatus Thermoplasmatota archaeon]|nr:tyrosine decarboxylase MfnA [Candidatus Thermoplasmatota archaeon]
MERKGLSRSEVDALLARFEDMNVGFSSGSVFGSMCTSPHEYAREVHQRFLESNLGNPGLCLGTLEMEKEVISMLGSLLNLPDATGYVLSGGTEANITAMYIAKKRASGRKVIFPGSVHFSILKAVQLLEMDPVPVGLDENFRMDLGELESKIDKDTALVIGVAGTTELGAVDPIKEISDLADGVRLHVDSAFGGFVLPFLEDMGMTDDRVGPWDLRVEGVSSICVDPHKMGWSTIPAGCLLFREKHPFMDMAVESPYLTSPKAYTLAGTRNSGAVASAFALMKHLGREGYCDLVRRCMENTRYLGKRMEELGLTKVMEPVMNLIAFHHPHPEQVQKRMVKKGFYISKVCDPPALRFVVMPHVTVGSIDLMADSLQQVLRSE